MSIEEIKNFTAPEEIFEKFQIMLEKYVSPYDKADKFFMVGYNCEKFDSQFLRQWFIDNGSNFYGSYFWVPTIDVMLLAVPILMEQRHLMKNFKLNTIARTFDIEVDDKKLHDAEYDIYLTEAVYKKIFDIE